MCWGALWLDWEVLAEMQLLVPASRSRPDVALRPLFEQQVLLSLCTAVLLILQWVHTSLVPEQPNSKLTVHFSKYTVWVSATLQWVYTTEHYNVAYCPEAQSECRAHAVRLALRFKFQFALWKLLWPRSQNLVGKSGGSVREGKCPVGSGRRTSNDGAPVQLLNRCTTGAPPEGEHLSQPYWRPQEHRDEHRNDYIIIWMQQIERDRNNVQLYLMCDQLYLMCI